MKPIPVILLFALTLVAAGQSRAKDSIFYIEEVSVSKAKSKLSRNETIGFAENSSLVTLRKNLPDARLKSITFYFGYKMVVGNAIKKSGKHFANRNF